MPSPVTRVSAHDKALANHMSQTFSYMSGGVGLSGLAAYFTLSLPGVLSLALNPVTQILFMVVWLGFGFVAHRVVFSLAPAAALGVFAAFSALTGFALAPLALVYTNASIATAFAVAAIMFAGASLYGYVTQKSLSGWGNFLMMGAWGLFGLIIVNLVSSLLGYPLTGLGFAISLIAVPLFAGITAWETNQIKETFAQFGRDEQVRSRLAILSATSLYANFVVMFIHLLNLIGQRR